jgi:hypothetical protein
MGSYRRWLEQGASEDTFLGATLVTVHTTRAWTPVHLACTGSEGLSRLEYQRPTLSIWVTSVHAHSCSWTNVFKDLPDRGKREDVASTPTSEDIYVPFPSRRHAEVRRILVAFCNLGSDLDPP